MTSVFVDTVFYLAIVNRRDAYHHHAAEVSRECAGHSFTTAWVLTEVGDAMASPAQRGVFTALKSWLSDKPDRVKFPYNIADKSVREQFEKTYAARDDVPIFSDPRIVPTFHGVGPDIFATIPRPARW